MSIRDQIRDDIYGSDQDDEKIELADASVRFSDLLESDRPYETPKTLLICVLAEIALIGAIFFGSRLVFVLMASQLVVYVVIGMILVPFLLGFTIAFTAYRLVKERFSRPEVPFDGPMSLIDRSSADSQMAIWFVSAAGGLANLAGFWILLLVMSNLLHL